MVYLDYNATTPCDERVVQAMEPYLCLKYGNPSSLYGIAREARRAVARAREAVAALIGASPEEVFFTGCGTEADNWAIKGTAEALKSKGNHIITTAIEHHAVLEPCAYLAKNGWEATFLPVDAHGLVDPEILEKSIKETTILVSVMWANNEIGTIEPIEELAEICRRRKVRFHTDAVQAAGKLPIRVKETGIDLLSLSAHKFHGPKGVGALYVRKGTRIAPLLHGGHQENGRRAGTENVAGIVGLGAAAELALAGMEEETRKEKRLRDRLEKELVARIPEVIVNGHPEKRLANTLNICVKYVEGEAMLLHLDAAGICASSGSACTSGSLDPSHVLLATGLPHEIAHGSLRFSFGRFSTDEDVDSVVSALPGIVEKLRQMSPFWDRK